MVRGRIVTGSPCPTRSEPGPILAAVEEEGADGSSPDRVLIPGATETGPGKVTEARPRVKTTVSGGRRQEGEEGQAMRGRGRRAGSLQAKRSCFTTVSTSKPLLMLSDVYESG